MNNTKKVTYHHGGFSYTTRLFTTDGVVNVTSDKDNEELSYSNEEMTSNPNDSTLFTEYTEWYASLS